MENHTPISKIIMRLAILKNYITLGDIDDMQREAEKLSQSSDHTDVQDIIFTYINSEPCVKKLSTNT
jgi:hypothetical protein